MSQRPHGNEEAGDDICAARKRQDRETSLAGSGPRGSNTEDLQLHSSVASRQGDLHSTGI